MGCTPRPNPGYIDEVGLLTAYRALVQLRLDVAEQPESARDEAIRGLAKVLRQAAHSISPSLSGGDARILHSSQPSVPVWREGLVQPAGQAAG